MKLFKPAVFFVVLLAFLSAGFFLLPFERSVSGSVRDFISGAGVFAPLVFIALQALQVVFLFVPGQITGFAGGFLFGAFWGTVYTMAGVVAGSCIAFAFSRKLGRPFVEKRFSPGLVVRFDFFSEQKGELYLFLVFLFPALPDNVASFAAGLTSIPLGRFLFISFFGRLPGLFLLNLAGSGVAEGDFIFSAVLFIVLAIVSFVFYVNRARIEGFVRRDER